MVILTTPLLALFHIPHAHRFYLCLIKASTYIYDKEIIKAIFLFSPFFVPFITFNINRALVGITSKISEKALLTNTTNKINRNT
jgi:hypothetical protein